jgi:hypothetical protein
MALNQPPLKQYDYANFALDDINEFAKGQGYATGVAAEAVRRPHTEAVAAKSVQVLPHRPLRNPLNRPRSK